MCTVLLPPGDNPIAVNKCIISYFVRQRCALFGQNNYKCLVNTRWCCYLSTRGRGGIQKLHFMGVYGAFADNQLKQTISADYNRATATEEEVYLHAFRNSSLLHGKEWSDSSPGHFIPSCNPIGGEVGWADESVWRR